MVFLGQWPYKHSETLDLEKRSGMEPRYYHVDKDMIVSKSSAQQLVNEGNIRDDKYYTVMSKEMSIYLESYLAQNFPPPIPHNVKISVNEDYALIINKMRNSSAVAIVGTQSREVMENVGAIWNDSLGMWLMHSLHLKTLVAEKSKIYGGKIRSEMFLDSSLKLEGDLGKHITLLRSIGATYDEKTNAWYVPLASAHKIAHILPS